MKTNLAKIKVITKGLEEKWVALTLDHTRVVDSSTDLASLEKRIGDNKKVVYMKVMASDREFAFLLENETHVG